MQLDIFDHSRDTMLRNDVAAAIERNDTSQGRSAWRLLRLEFPDDEQLSPLDLLLRTLEHRSACALPDHDALQQERRVLNQEVAPAARRILGPASATAWLARLWRELARRAARLAFVPERGEEHAAPLWLLGGEWDAAAQAVAGIASWRRIPAPLAWMAEARYRLNGLDAAFALLCELAWLSPQRFDALAPRFTDARLDRLLGKFHAEFEGDGDTSDLAWFPAWLLTEKPGMADLLDQAQGSPERTPVQATRLLLELLRLERQGRHRDVVERRRALRDTHAFLYAAYMATR